MPITFPSMPEKLTANEAALLEFINQHSDRFLFLSIAQLAETLSMSEATVSRFARHVGCRDFKHLKQVVLAQTQTRTGPADKLAATLAEGDGAPLPHWLEQQRYCLEKTEALLDPAEFHRAVQAIVEARRVFVYAKNASRSMAELLDWQREAGYRTLLFTGQLSPLPDPQPDIRLFVYRGEANEYHSMAAPAAIVDALVLGVSAKLGDRAVDRLARLRALKQRYTNP